MILHQLLDLHLPRSTMFTKSILSSFIFKLIECLKISKDYQIDTINDKCIMTNESVNYAKNSTFFLYFPMIRLNIETKESSLILLEN